MIIWSDTRKEPGPRVYPFTIYHPAVLPRSDARSDGDEPTHLVSSSKTVRLIIF